MYPKLHLITLKNCSIFEQLQLEEKLLRTEEKSFCIFNIGSPKSIVMGISGKPLELLNIERVKEDQIPVIQRFSGGGTVIVDENTLFITFIMSKKDLPIPLFPEPIHKWAANLYQLSWQIPGFHFRENDYCIEDRKCGGNAQYIRKERWLHHTSFLWDFEEEKMDYLLLPSRRPAYRKDRSHLDFLCRLKELKKSPESLISSLKEELVKQFYIEELSELPLDEKEYRKSLKLIDL